MRYADLRDFIAQLERQGELRRIGAPVSPRFEMTEIADRVLRAQGPALLFEAPQTGFVIRDPADPSEALRAVLSASDVQLAEMGIRAAELARTHFDAPAVARSLVSQLYG